jgi:hypothetical protein
VWRDAHDWRLSDFLTLLRTALLKITLFPGSIVGYAAYPEAVLTRGLAHGLAERGHDVRVVEERQNELLKRTLLEIGSEPSRHFHDHFKTVQYHTYEPRTGAQLLEWVTRELALIDVSVAVDGVEQELCRWLGNVNRAGLLRAFLTFDPDSLDDRRAAELDIDKYDVVIAPSRPAADLPWAELPPALAPQDDLESIRSFVPDQLIASSRDPAEVALMFEQVVSLMRR